MSNFNDRFLYSNGTLRNKLGITDSRELAQIEYRLSGQIMDQLIKHPVKIKNLRNLQLIHKAMFGCLYSWAGQFRTYQLQKERSKGPNLSGSWFLRSNSFVIACNYIDKLINEIQKKSEPNSVDYARLLDTINYLHPFREGNGRATKTFLQIIAENHKQYIDYDRHRQSMIKALQDADVKRIAKYLKIR